MSISYEMQPLDTLFFRGSIPMEAGMQNVVSVFPPPVTVLSGAFWTAACQLACKGTVDYGKPSDMPKVQGFFIKKNGVYYAPAPSTWYYDSEKKAKTGRDLKGVSLKVAEKLNERISEHLGIKTSAGDVVFVKAENEAQPLADCWVKTSFFTESKSVFDEDTVLLKSDVYVVESRTGVTLDNHKHTVEGQLYTATHIRLKDDISMVVVFEDNEKLNFLGSSGKLQLGGEKRVIQYKVEAGMGSQKCDSELWVSSVPVMAENSLLSEKLIASGKLFVTSGWDFAKKFHKETVNWIPAGAVFNENVNNSCLPLGKKADK